MIFFKAVLKIEQVGIYDNFFYIGGHSLLATQLAVKISQYFNVDCPVRLIFEAPTVEQLTVDVIKLMKEGAIALPEMQLVDKLQPLPLSFAQERLWFIDQYSGGQSHFYNMPVALRLTGQLDVRVLEQSFNSLLSRHMSLRTIFIEDNGTPKQVIQSESLFELTPQIISEDELQLTIESLGGEAFDLANGPVFKVKLFEVSSQEHILFVNMHHIVSDGVSNEIMFNDFVAAYNAYREGNEPSSTNTQISIC